MLVSEVYDIAELTVLRLDVFNQVNVFWCIYVSVDWCVLS